MEMVNVACQHLGGSCLFFPPYKQGPSVKFIFQPDSCCGQIDDKYNAHWNVINQLSMYFTCSVKTTFDSKQYTQWADFLFKLSRARIKAALCKLLVPFGQVTLNKEFQGFIERSLFMLCSLQCFVTTFGCNFLLSIHLHSVLQVGSA